MKICKIKNHWEIKHFCYWENELTIEDEDTIWINIGFVCPFIANKNNFQSIVAQSAYYYAEKFN